MSDLLTREREKYETAWSLSAYATTSPGEQLLPIFLDMTKAGPSASVLDAGCGAGKGALALAAAGLTVTMCDHTDAGLTDEALAVGPFVQTNLWDDLAPVAYLANVARGRQTDGLFDYAYCCDVLEHIPTPFVMLVVARLLAVTTKGVFLSISTQPDNFGAMVGEPLHLTVQSFVQWRDQLATMGRLVEARDLIIAGCYLVEPRC